MALWFAREVFVAFCLPECYSYLPVDCVGIKMIYHFWPVFKNSQTTNAHIYFFPLDHAYNTIELTILLQYPPFAIYTFNQFRTAIDRKYNQLKLK